MNWVLFVDRIDDAVLESSRKHLNISHIQYIRRMQTTTTTVNIDAAIRHYEALKRAQQRYYDKKAGAVENRRPRGRPRKVVAPVSTDVETA